MYLAKMEEPMVLCPFNKHHRVSVSKLQYHIVRCMKNYPDHLVCPYNAVHRLLKHELSEHLSSCPDRKVLKEYPDPNQDTIENNRLGSGDNSHYNLEFENWD